jgi:hypothetical protein
MFFKAILASIAKDGISVGRLAALALFDADHAADNV